MGPLSVSPMGGPISGSTLYRCYAGSYKVCAVYVIYW